jgi:putative transposase
MDEKPETKPMGQVIQIDEARIRDHLGEMVRGTVEEALNAMLDAEADRLSIADQNGATARRDTGPWRLVRHAAWRAWPPHA